MKKLGLAVMVTMILLSLAGCVSTTTISPYFASMSFPAEGDYEILGLVDYTGQLGNAGYIEFLKVAQRKFPETDAVVNIMVDEILTVESNYIMPVLSRGETLYTMVGTAIRYTKKPRVK